MDRVECIVVGAGVVGLALARAIARRGREVVILESEEVIGSGVSSRNSCVIHAGLYYAADSVKARVCVAGKHALYAFCEDYGVGHARTGKLIVATKDDQLPALEGLREKARANGVDDLEFLDPAAVRAIEPEVRCSGAMLSPSTGIIDVHEYMLALQGDAEAHGAMLALASPCTGGSIEDDGFHLAVGGAEPFEIACDLLVNSAAFGAQPLARALRGLPAETVPPLHHAKGNYFSLTGRSPFSHLIYPMPSDAWLGIHSSLDLGGRCRFGPDLEWVEGLDHDVDPARAESFYDSIRRYWPGLPDGALNADYAGIRPKLTPRGVESSDFVIQTPAEHGVPGLVNLYGIESPGLTSSLAIAEEVAEAIA